MSAECTSFIIDVSNSMVSNYRIDNIISYLEYVFFDKVKKSRKTDYISVYLCNSKETNNFMGIEYVYQVCEFIAPMTSIDLCNISHYIRNMPPMDENLENNMDKNLLLSSLEIKDKFGKTKMDRKIMIFTDDLVGLNLQEDEINALVGEFNGRFILIDCNDEQQDLKEDESSWIKLINCAPKSQLFHINELLEEIASPKPATVKPVRIFTGDLRLGADISTIMEEDTEIDPFTDPFSLCMRVEGYPATKSVTSLSKKTVLKTEDKKYSSIKSIVEYELHNDKKDTQSKESDMKEKFKEKEGEKEGELPYNIITVSKDYITKAYRYGSDYAVLPPPLAEKFYYETIPGLDIRGFVDESSLPRYYLSSESVFILADTRMGSMADIFAFGVLVDAMYKNEKVAIARYVQKKLSDVEMVALIPLRISTENINAKSDVRALILNRIPFAEDMRVSDFPKLVNRRTTSGKSINVDEDETIELDKLMNEFVDSMDMDNLTGVADDKYYQSINEVNSDTTLVLPASRRKVEKEEDPLRMLAITNHLQVQVLREYLHQISLKGDEGLSVNAPTLPRYLAEKIEPHVIDSDRNDRISTDLMSLARLAKTDDTEKAASRATQEQLEAVAEGPPVEDLLAAGRRNQ
ncbi:hypothetical protein KAFR_0A00590 [Kazachstania africana CBS 2517]|uniref:ATP-dependent DNA helicase II subunit 2 n=1 Tax=Kazachstania africana (strain ATCC 22294 / BCRC 22015 / CBS 2517 / CECT 1963 / NBRC 1671 / NRRL Y-8276) TaxID=1071382 RepID=H2AM97_KAZAF|nr:hypothetical protein KAFR_0A00590 [Kazachstania africana CBS 2517]CCF55497.1 hypothetical protein KAFR_0A00590 [Kazachstania africana CBS 2517]